MGSRDNESNVNSDVKVLLKPRLKPGRYFLNPPLFFAGQEELEFDLAWDATAPVLDLFV